MKKKNTIGEIYHLTAQVPAETSLIKHYNSILLKTPESLNSGDVAMLIRQGLFPEIAIPKAIVMIKNNHSIGDLYDYELLFNFAESNVDLSTYKKSVEELINILVSDFTSVHFELESDKTDYLHSLDLLKSRI